MEERQSTVLESGFPQRFYIAEIEFTYEVCGQSYQSRKYSRRNFSLGIQGDSDEIFGGAKVGDAVDVFYNPQHPSEATLKLPEFDMAIATTFLGSLVVGLVILLSFV